MNATATPIPSATETALLILDGTGTVRAANAAAGRLWQTRPADLAGQKVVALFAFEITSSEPDWRESQWEILIETSLDRPLRLKAQPFEPVPAFDVQIELQVAHGPDTVYFARVNVVTATAASTAAAPAVPVSFPLADGLAHLAASGQLGFFDLDPVAGKLVTSPAWKRMLGYLPDELPDTHEAWRGLIHPDDTDALPDRAGRHAQTGHRDFSVEIRLRHRLGHYIWVQSTGLQVFGPGRDLRRVIGVHLDITERKEAEELGFASEDRLERLADAGRLAVFDFDFTTGAHWASQAFLDQFDPGLPPADSLLAVLPEDDAEAGLAAFLSSLDPGEAFTTRALALRRAEGLSTPALLGVHRQWSRKRELVRAVGFLLPLPPVAGDGPVPSALLPGTLDALNEAVLVADAQSRIVYLNEKAARLTGTTAAEARDFKLNDVLRLVRRQDGRPDESAVELVLASEEKPRLNADHALARDDHLVPILWTPRQLRGPNGEPAGIVVVFRDPQEMTLTPEELVRSNRFDSLGQLAGGIAHDFNNLLTTILGGVSSAKDSRDYTRLADAESACLEAKSLTRQLLTFAKGGVSAQQILPVRDLLQDAVRIAAAGTCAVVTVEAAEDVPPIEVDRGQIIQVFQNLIINALQAMPDLSRGVVRLAAREVSLAENDVPPLAPGPHVRIDVSDNGSGIPPESVEKIFEPFYTTKKQGTGLGLATVLAIVRRHGGQIGVASTVGQGTTFTLFFPKATRQAAAAARTPAALRFGTGRILFMDDDPKIRELTAGMLTGLDYTHDVVASGEDAITCYRRYLNIGRPYDAVILDLNVIGGMGGEACFKQLRDLHPEVRAIVNSGYDSDEMARRYLDMGFVGYLTKPYRVGDLARVLKAALGKA